MNGGGAKSGDQAEETSDDERECDAEEQHAPVCGKGEAQGIVWRIDGADDKGSGPPCEESAD